ncbi:MAG: phosphate ABC transporter ATP-binding protein [Oscillospiraceae bacterium]|nr:phosphate ABC transporter ATP-binding protein [Oscillospiraceae bacterium]
MVNEKICIQNLSVRYGDVNILKDISTFFKENSITALIGSSGCGKSTLLRTINRLTDLDGNCAVEGKILLDKKDIFRDIGANELRKRVGMVFQKPNPFDMSIYDNIAFGPRIHGIKSKIDLDEIAENTLRSAALWDEVKDYLKKNALKLSGGQQQRLCIARALAVKPEVLLMDEATSALDPTSAAKIEEVMLELKQRCTIIAVTHSMAQAIRISDKTVFLANGMIIEEADTAKLFTSPQEAKTKQFIKSALG